MITFACNSEKGQKAEYTATSPTNNTLTKIKQQGQLTVGVDYSSTDYFVYRGAPMGFSYEILKELSQDLGVDLRIQIISDIGRSFDEVNKDNIDIVAQNLTVTNSRKKKVDFSTPLMTTNQVLVQRGSSLSRSGHSPKGYISSPLQLDNKTVHIRKNSAYKYRLENIADEMGINITIVEDSIYGVEQLIAMVAKGDIDYTICDKHVGVISSSYYPWIDTNTAVSFEQNLSWALSKNDDEWNKYLNNWIIQFKASKKYARLYSKYYNNNRSKNLAQSDFHSFTGGKISDYDQLIQGISDSMDIDWRLIASIIYQESRFDPNAESWVGAQGLMQLMPTTADIYGVENIKDPTENIVAGIKHLKWLDKIFVPIITDSTERLNFVLASYNVGLGHVKDARKLAFKYGKDPDVWKNNVDYFVLNKSTKKYYTDPIVKWGYCRGEEPFKYVMSITDRYHHYMTVNPVGEELATLAMPIQR